MSAHLSPPHHPSLAAGDTKKQPHLGADPGRRTSSCFGGDHSSTKKPGPSAAKLALASFLGVIVLLAADASLAGAGAHRRLRRQYLRYVGVGSGGASAGSPPAWLSVPDRPNFTDDLLARWLAPGGSPCRDARTANISVPALDGAAARGRWRSLARARSTSSRSGPWTTPAGGAASAGTTSRSTSPGARGSRGHPSWTAATAPTPSASRSGPQQQTSN